MRIQSKHQEEVTAIELNATSLAHPPIFGLFVFQYFISLSLQALTGQECGFIYTVTSS